MQISAEQPFTGRDLSRLVRRYRRTFLVALIVALIAAGLAFLLVKRTYVAESLILVKLGKDELVGIEAIPREQNNFLLQQRGQIINNEVQILRDPVLTWMILPEARQEADRLEAEALRMAGPLSRKWLDIRKAIQEAQKPYVDRIRKTVGRFLPLSSLSADEAFAIRLARSLKVVAIEETEVIRVSVEAGSPQFAAYVANAYVKAYMARRQSVHSDNRSEKFYDEQVVQTEARLKSIEERVAAFKIDRKISSLDLQRELVVKDIADLERQVFQVDTAINEVNVRRAEVEKSRRAGIVPSAPERLGADFSALDSAYFELASQRARLGQAYNLSRETTDADLAERQDWLRTEKAQNVTRILASEATVRASAKRGLEERLVELRQRLDQINADGVTLAALERERDLLRTSYLSYAKKSEELRVSADLDRSNVTSVKALSDAVAPLLPASPKFYILLMVALAAAIAVSSIWAVCKELLGTRIRDEHDVATRLGLTTLATLRWDPRLGSHGG